MPSLLDTITGTAAYLTGPGAPFEVVLANTPSGAQRQYRNAFPTLGAMLQVARGHGDKVFIVFDGESYTFTQLFAHADALAAHWQQGVSLQAGDRVAIALRNRPEWAVALVAAWLCGAVPVPLNSLGQRDELCACLDDVTPKVLVLDEERWARLEGAPQLTVISCHVVGTAAWRLIVQARDQTPAQTLVNNPHATPQPVEQQTDDAALILYTSGASSRAKGVVSSHRAVCQALFNIDFIGAFSAATSPEALKRLMARGLAPTTLTAVPLFHVSGLHAQLLLALRHGRRLVFMRRFEPAAALALIQVHQVTQFNGAPAMVAQLLAEPRFDEMAAPTLGGLGFGGAGLPKSVMQAALQRLPGAMSGIGFGMTESNGVGAAVSGELFAQQPSAAGVVSPIIDVRIVLPNGANAAPNEQGEICLRGVSLMQGYWRQPEATATALAGGWLHTGDVGYLDDNGMLRVVDRLKDVINRSGEKIASLEVESCLLQHPQVREVAVLGVPDARTDEAVVAVVVLQPGTTATATATAAELQAHVAQHLAAYKVPSSIRLVSEPLPRNPAGKVLKSELRRQWLLQALA